MWGACVSLFYRVLGRVLLFSKILFGFMGFGGVYVRHPKLANTVSFSFLVIYKGCVKGLKGHTTVHGSYGRIMAAVKNVVPRLS